MSYTPTYHAWQSMKDRCYNSNDKKFRIYGAAGIIVCERWLAGFKNFLEDMGERPDKYYSLDRYPNPKGNYEPGNCRWATQKQQQNNRTNNRLLTFEGETKTLSEWAEAIGIKQPTLWVRLNKYGWSLQRALETPTLDSRVNLKHFKFK